MTYLAVGLLWAAAGYRLYLLRRSHTVINVTLAAAVVGIAAAFTAKAAEAPIDSVTAPYASDLIEHLLVVFGGGAAQLFLLALRTGQPPRRAGALRAGIAVCVAVVMTVAFATVPIAQQASTADFDVVYGQLEAVMVYRLVFDLYLTYVLVDNVRLCRRYAATPDDFGLSTSLALVGWGSAVAVIYSASRVVYVIADLTLHDQLTGVRRLGSVAASLGLSALAVGILAPRVAVAGRGWLEASAGTRRLDAIWRDLTAAFPAVALPTGAAWTTRRAELRYDRRVVEVSEGLAQARIAREVLDEVERDGDPITVVAEALRRSRPTWAQAAGTPAGQLLPLPANRRDERAQLLALADAYSGRIAEPASGTEVAA